MTPLTADDFAAFFRAVTTIAVPFLGKNGLRARFFTKAGGRNAWIYLQAAERRQFSKLLYSI